MPNTNIKKIISCSKENLIKMVLDIEKYPEFVPWCLESKVYSKTNKGNTVTIIADLTIGKSFFREKYKSLVIYNKTNDIIHATNSEGPLKYLENKWLFKPIGNKCEINFYVDFELKSKILNLLMMKYFDVAVKKIVDAFEKRATSLFY